ncbi:lipid IV(A) 3-deoxy-D-manno-octulosonic acid transferase [Salinivibrio sharmensis]|uniref:3-deoxy-D-manno-octulosonic acid transferase n=1 Tax=Salinivibrio sharmensis TaxID=390883 RepID=A0ABX3KIK5_9GAMM|nr:lipid IV(A) 3-deoxy-D-manno-octulosonic acid transferase [Salinivibrio sharmensis]OOE88926.1 3-deoxy-D-manno-octulosonic acid transferase [Salinivibrio sharmensis]
MRWIYTLLLTLAAPFLLVGLYRKRPGKPAVGERWREHFGGTPNVDGQPIWLHAVSVGEVLAAKPVISALQQVYPDVPILVTTTTATGAEQAERIDGVIHRYMPVDFPFAVKRFLRAVSPRLCVIMETELWPNTLHHVGRAGIPITVINARLSQKACQRYQKIAPLFHAMSKHIDLIVCQHQNDQARFASLGVAHDKLAVAGSVKFDIKAVDPALGAALREARGERPCWIGASTHAGEDATLLTAHSVLLRDYPDALLILVPRHPERFDDVAQQVATQGLSVQRRTEGEPLAISTQVYLGDTMGEMMTYLAAADVVVMAGSFLGTKVGGHNLLEPAALGKPLLTGPSYYNFQVIGDALIEAGALQVCNDSQDLAAKIGAFFSAPALAAQAGNAGLSVVEQNRGAVERTLQALAPWLNRPR